MKDIGDKAQLARILAAGVVLLLLLWTVLAPPARAHSEGPRPILATELFLRHDDPALAFRWQVAPEVALEPALFRRMRSQAEQALAAQRRESGQALADARRAKFPERAWSWSQRWSTAHLSGPLLVLSGEAEQFSGGAHGNPSRARLIHDRASKADIGVEALFTDWAAIRPRLQAMWCEDLARQRKQKRGPEAAVSPQFDSCPDLKELTVYPLGDPEIHSLMLVADPYVAGPYSEGFYESLLILDDALLAAVKPRYREAFAKP